MFNADVWHNFGKLIKLYPVDNNLINLQKGYPVETSVNNIAVIIICF